ncbi:endonuclease/exonuclease/phosphatase family protein [Pseudoalteromonas sp. SS15]|uniref:endonuclease/exonuclease/phosphatase family protein n=1 Tax=Pseudoalteromonas sp. SS15 TaxID=3139393 RepID=UPI003BAD77AA
MLFILLLIELILLLLILLPLVALSGEYYLLDLLSNFQLHFFILALFFSIPLLLKSVKVGTVSAVLSIAFFASSHLWWFSKAQPLEAKYLDEPPKLHIVQANLSYYNPVLRTAVEELNSLDADLYLFYEFNQEQKPLFLEIAAKRYKFGNGDYDGFPDGMGVISKYPLTNIKKHKILPKKGTVITLTLQLPKQKLDLILLHPPSPRTPDKWQKRNVLLGSVQPLVELAKNKHILVAGDFNTTPWSNHFPRHHQLTPCYQQTGMYASWHASKYLHPYAWLTGLPIDHCLTSNNIKVSQFKTHSLPGSDHLALDYKILLVD